MPKYTLKCLKTNEQFEDNYTLHYEDGALIQADYKMKFDPSDELGVWKYSNWLPTNGISEQIAGTVTYHAEELGERLGLSNLWVAFNGFWPEKGALCPTGSFKDMEAVPTIQRMKALLYRNDLCVCR